MIVGLLVLVVYQGLRSFWPLPLVELKIDDGTGTSTAMLGEITRREDFRPEPSMLDELKGQSPELFVKAEAAMKADAGQLRRELIWTGRTGQLDFPGSRATWVNDFALQSQSRPEWATTIERLDGGRSYGTPDAFLIDGQTVATGPAEVWRKYIEIHSSVIDRWNQAMSLDRNDRGAIDRRQRAARLNLVGAQLDLKEAQQAHNDVAIQKASAAVASRQEELTEVNRWADQEKSRINQRIKKLNAENDRYAVRFQLASGESLELPLADIGRAYPANRLTLFDKLGVYFSRWWEFISADPGASRIPKGVFSRRFGALWR